MSASEVRALFAVASRPEVVSLAGGMPFVEAIPAEHVLEAVQAVMRDRGAIAPQYGGGPGGGLPCRRLGAPVKGRKGSPRPPGGGGPAGGPAGPDPARQN